MIYILSLLVAISVCCTDSDQLSADQKTTIDATWVNSVLNGEKLSFLLNDDEENLILSGLIFYPDSTLTESMPIITPPPIDEGILIPLFQHEQNINLPPVTTD